MTLAARVQAPFTATLVALAASASCAPHTPGLRPTDAPNAASSYLYGRFRVSVPETSSGLDGYETVRLTLRCTDGATYTIRFTKDRGVQVIQTRPARCALVEVTFTDADGFPWKRQEVRGDPPGGVQMAPSTAYYLGDFFAKVTSGGNGIITGVLLGGGMDVLWKMTGAEDNYDLTTTEMKTTFPKLASLPTENRMIAPHRHLPGESRPHKGGEPMEPERVARVARFTNRSYATPVECEAACPTGECLPYRGRAGAAMTCIVHCKTDKDCPEGLGCNCPEADASDCRPIARTPTDAMAGICLFVDAPAKPE